MNADVLATQNRFDLTKAIRLFQVKDMHRAMHICRYLLARNPEQPEVLHLMALMDFEGGRYTDASAKLTQAISLAPGQADFHNAMGLVRMAMGQYDAALASFRTALSIKPELLKEDYKPGCVDSEWRLRFQYEDSKHPNRYGLPIWKGQNLKDKTILVYDEQEFGDMFMIGRCLMALKNHGARVVYETTPELFDLFKRMVHIDEISLRQPSHPPATKCDYYIPSMRLPSTLGINGEAIHFDAPYHFADPDRTSVWARKIPQGVLRVGLVWHAYNSDHVRSISMAQLSMLSHLPGIRYYGLQKEFKPETDGQNGWIVQLGPELKDFADIAAVIANLDLIITIDTVIAHLAGAMMKQVWVLVPCVPNCRCFKDKNTSPWYTTVQFYRQPAPGDWDTPIKSIADDLIKIVRKRNNQTAKASIKSQYASACKRHRKGDFSGAESLYREILTLDPEHHAAASCLGLLYLETGRNEAAIKALQLAIRVKPDDALSMNNLGLALHRSGHFERAVSVFLSAISCNPDYTNAYHNLGNVFFDMQDLDSTILWYKKALDLEPDNAKAQFEMSKLYLKKLDLAGARVHLENSVRLSPDDAQTRISLATTALMQGDFSTGWFNYQWRFKSKEIRKQSYPHRYKMPRWRGESFQGKRLLVHCEQGFGDTIQFSRFLPQVQKLGGQITFQFQAPLFPLFRNFPGVDRVEFLTNKPSLACDADLCIPLLDLPMCLGTEVKTIPAEVPYLEAEPHRIHHWRQYVRGGHLNIGVAWSGNPHHKNDHNRSCELEDVLFLCEDNRVKFFSLQKEVTDKERNIIVGRSSITHLGDQLTDFGETAAVIACLDLVITVDTAIAHLAGAMAKPTWVLLPFLPDWRWMILRNDSPWYPTLRLFRQSEAGDWAGVMQAVRIALEKELGGA